MWEYDQEVVIWGNLAARCTERAKEGWDYVDRSVDRYALDDIRGNSVAFSYLVLFRRQASPDTKLALKVAESKVLAPGEISFRY